MINAFPIIITSLMAYARLLEALPPNLHQRGKPLWNRIRKMPVGIFRVILTKRFASSTIAKIPLRFVTFSKSNGVRGDAPRP
jgi:hypothetical protein